MSVDPFSIVVGLGWTITSAACAMLAIPLARGRVAPNAMYGVRLPASFASAEAWLAINRAGGRRLIAASVAMFLVGAIALLVPLRDRPGVAMVFGFGPLAFLLAAIVDTWRVARRPA